jgi:hypothetical protein
MLGRLEMTIEECLQVFKTMSRDIFAPSWKHTPVIKEIGAIFGRPWFNAKDLENALKKVLVEKDKDADIPLRETRDPPCKV